MKFLSRKVQLLLALNVQLLSQKEPDPKPALNLYARFGKLKPHINFLGHTDVVANLSNWKISPFLKALVKNGYLNSRGSQDMKGGVACWISAVSNFIKDNKFKGSIQLLFQQMKRQRLWMPSGYEIP